VLDLDETLVHAEPFNPSSKYELVLEFDGESPTAPKDVRLYFTIEIWN